ncbi:MAG TPA: hypothetical protein VHC69_26350 [Polyangiaceae bacterium]|nr:hypothetical protein [Polyangiaceae bacterium]
MAGRPRILLTSSRRRSCRAPLRATVAIAVALSPRAALAAPSSPPAQGVVVARGDECSVALVAASYDDPGADTAEFVELRVDGASNLERNAATRTDGAARRSASATAAKAAEDGGSRADGGADAATASDGSPSPDAVVSPTLASCGLSELDLVDGANGGCATYRRIPLGDLPIPADGFVVLCPAGSSVDQRARCDVTAAGRSALRGGWLQNGPNDGLRFVASQSAATVDLAYEGRPACFGSDSVALATESGAEDGDAAVDDVNVACGGRFVLLPQSAVPFRTNPTCPAARDAGAGDGGLVGSTGAVANDAGLDAPWTPERAPPPVDRGSPRVDGPLSVDASLFPSARSSASPPEPPGCAVMRGRSNDRASDLRGATALIAALALFVGRARSGHGGGARLRRLRL